MLFHASHDLDAEGPLLVLVHGVGGHGDLWAPFRQALGGLHRLSVVTLDLAGHGRSAHSDDYSIAAQARAVGEVVDHVLTRTDPHRPVVHVGHSMGGMVGMLDAAQRPAVRAVLCCSTKYQWGQPERGGLLRQAAKPVRTHATREEALARHLTLTGLHGTLSTDNPLLEAGVQRRGEAWQVSQDPRTYDIGEPDVPRWRSALGVPTPWLLGERDPLIPVASARAVSPHVLAAVGHNPHLEAPGATAAWVLDQLTALDLR